MENAKQRRFEVDAASGVASHRDPGQDSTAL
jgi:hypothetical protein